MLHLAVIGIIFPALVSNQYVMADNNRNRGSQQGKPGQNQRNQTNIGNQQGTSQTSSTNQGGRNLNQQQDQNVGMEKSNEQRGRGRQ